MDIFSGIANAMPVVTDLYNIWSQERAYQDQKDFNKDQWQREDTAYQRKAADLKAAGFSKNMAVSGPGSPSSAVRVGSAPQMSDPAQDYINYQRSLNDIAMSIQQQELNDSAVWASTYKALTAKEEYSQAKIDTEIKRATQDSIKSQTLLNTQLLQKGVARADLDNAIKANDLAIGTMDKQTYYPRMIGNALSAITGRALDIFNFKRSGLPEPERYEDQTYDYVSGKLSRKQTWRR